MPDFFDRLLARDARQDGGPAAAARTADLEQRAGVTRTFPRVPIMFEWPEVAITEQVTETGATPAPPAGTAPASAPGVASWPVPPAGQPGSPAPVPPAPADRGTQTGLRPWQPLLVPPALPSAPAEAAGGQAFVPREGGPEMPPAPARRDRGAGTGAPGRGEPGAPPRSRPSPARGLAETASVPPARGVALPTARASRHAAPPPERVVQVRIGRIEVRPAESAGPRRPAGRSPGRPEPRLSLERFLAGEDGGR